MIIVRVAITALLLAAIWFASVVPYRWNREELRLERRTLAALRLRHVQGTRVLARQNAEALAHAPLLAQNANTWMLLGANHRVVERFDAAERAYLTALRFDRRPEIYLQLGNAQLRIGKKEEAFRNLYLAAIGDPDTVREIEDPEMLQRVYDASSQRDRAIVKRIESTH